MGDENILIATHDGMAVCFDENDVRPMGRTAVGVRGIRLRQGDFVVGAGSTYGGEALLSITEKGYGKRTAVEEYSVHGRGGLGIRNYNVTERTGPVADVKMVNPGEGIRNYNVTERTGPVADVKMVNPGEDLLVISDDGTIIRMAVDNISLLGRATQGVRVMRLMEGSRVISIEKTMRETEESAEGESETEPGGEE